MSITFSTCFYIIHSKFPKETYLDWLNHFVSIVNQFYLVLYTDANTLSYLDTSVNSKNTKNTKNNNNATSIINRIKNNPNIKIVLKPLEDFYNYKYKEDWIKNHTKNVMLNTKSSWELNMLWSEKIRFVKETRDKKYFNTEMYGWCDAGYFRNRNGDLNTTYLKTWANKEKIQGLDKTKIHYALVNNDNRFIHYMVNNINQKNEHGLPVVPIIPNQVSVAGGFFILHEKKIDWWSSTLDDKLQLYFKHDYLVKDDQMLIADCIFTSENQAHFSLFTENNQAFDNWFMFQRILQ